MPSFYAYGVHAFLELQDRSSKIPESASKITWNPMQGMSHPILSTNVVSPAKLGSPLPFCIVVEFDSDNGHYSINNLKGDVRIEVKIDGLVSGWRVLPQAKIWPKGTRIEFSGLRVARTEEMAYMLRSPLRNLRRSKTSLAASTPKSLIEVTHTAETSTIRNPEDPTLVPSAPSGLPPNTSHIEILITVGKKHNTLEKYLIFSPVLQEAFYIPPKKLEPKQSDKSGYTSTTEVIRPPHRTDNMEVDGQPRRNWRQGIYIPAGADKKMNEWKPIGFASVSQKTPQMREAEFTASMHLARFWFIIYPETVNLNPPKAPISSTPLASIGGQHVTDLVQVLTNNKKSAQKSTLDDSAKCDVARVGESDTMAGRQQRVTTKMRTSEINEPSTTIHRPQEDDNTRGSMPVMRDITSKSRASQETKTTLRS